MARDERVFLGLGSNLGDRQENLSRALEEMAKIPQTGLIKNSSLYRTQPVGKVDQPEFLNLAVEIQTLLEPEELLDHLRAIENLLGRVRAERWGPRTVDIDILYYGSRILSAPGLSVPHPRIYERAFVLVPLAEIAPEWVDPVKGLSVDQLLVDLSPSPGAVVKLAGCLAE